MIYEEPVFRVLGDTTLNVEFGDETSIPLNFRILALDRAIRANPLQGLIETNPQVRTLGIVYNPLVTGGQKLRAYVKDLLASETEVKTLPSRRVTIPALYDDPWSRECAAAFGVRNNIEYIAEFNHVTVSEVVGPPYRFGLLGDGRRFRSRCFHVLRDGSAQEIRRTAVPNTANMDPFATA